MILARFLVFYMARSQTPEFYSYEKVISYIISAGTSSFWL